MPVTTKRLNSMSSQKPRNLLVLVTNTNWKPSILDKMRITLVLAFFVLPITALAVPAPLKERSAECGASYLPPENNTANEEVSNDKRNIPVPIDFETMDPFCGFKKQ